MCRLLAVIGKTDNGETLNILEKFRQLAKEGHIFAHGTPGHKDGWGMSAHRRGKQICFRKSAEDAFQDSGFTAAAEDLAKKDFDLAIGHLRKAAGSGKKMKNSQPFVFHGFTFCHNGVVYGSDKLPLEKKWRERLQGETDSEKLFYFIIQNLPSGKKISKRVLQESAKFIRQNFDYSAMNILLTDGKKLFVLRDMNKNYWEYKKEKLSEYYTLYLGNNKRKNYKIVCSEKLKIKGVVWKVIKDKELLEINIAK